MILLKFIFVNLSLKNNIPKIYQFHIIIYKEHRCLINI